MQVSLQENGLSIAIGQAIQTEVAAPFSRCSWGGSHGESSVKEASQYTTFHLKGGGGGGDFCFDVRGGVSKLCG